MTDNDDTQYMDDGDETRVWSPEDEADEQTTRVIPPTGAESTRRMERPLSSDPPPTRRITRDVVEPGGPPTQVLRTMQPRGASPAGIIALVVVLALIIGALIGWTQHTPKDRNVVARSLVGLDGGQLTFGNGGELDVPSGALQTATAITIRKETVDHRVRLGSADQPNSKVFEAGQLTVYVFEPSTLRFNQPVTIALPRSSDTTAVFVDSDPPRVIGGTARDGLVEIHTTSFRFEDGATS